MFKNLTNNITIKLIYIKKKVKNLKGQDNERKKKKLDPFCKPWHLYFFISFFFDKNTIEKLEKNAHFEYSILFCFCFVFILQL